MSLSDNYQEKKQKTLIRVNCYMAVMDKFKDKYPKAHFEVITRTSGSPLSPSRRLLNLRGGMSLHEYKKRVKIEILKRAAAIKRMSELLEIAKKRDVFLVCYEKNPNNCHRSLVLDMLIDMKNGMFQEPMESRRQDFELKRR